MIAKESIIHRLQHLRRAPTAYGPAPHKPVLLLTLFEMMDEGVVMGNRFPITEELVKMFRVNWRLLVTTGHVPDFTQPFYHLKNELVDGQQLWDHRTYDGFGLAGPIKSFNLLRSRVSFGFFNPEVYQWLVQAEFRQQATSTVAKAYFPQTWKKYYDKKLRSSYELELEKEVMSEAPEEYKKEKKEANAREEALYVRGGVFKQQVPKAYDYTCAITGMKVLTHKGQGLIEACHIIPVSHGGPDHISNGMALCPNLHTAFDRGLVTVDEQYKVVVSNAFEEEANDYSIKKYHGRDLRLPFGKSNYPLPAHFEYHRREIFFG